MDEHIVTSRLDTDFYKFTMDNVIVPYRQGVHVKYALKNRTTDVNLADHISESDLRRELDYARTLHLTKTELHYLRGTNEYQDRMFPESYLEFVAKNVLPDYKLKYSAGEPDQKELLLEFSGTWSPTTHWEIHALEVISELYYKSLMKDFSKFERDVVYARGKTRLWEKIKIFRQYPDILISDFGTRRRHSKLWHEYVVTTLAEELRRQFLGTSNVEFAMKHSLLPMGTAAHELDMVVAGMAKENEFEIRNAHRKVLGEWWDKYGYGLSIALPDTFGSDAGLVDMTAEQVRAWKGLRQDSGDPIEFGEKAIQFYTQYGVDPKDKVVVFSDGLTVEDIVKIYLHFKGRIRTTFGWGTNLTNDLGFKPLSLVIKVVEVNGRGAVKLSDNISKAIGKPEDIERYKKIFGYIATLNKPCVY